MGDFAADLTQAYSFEGPGVRLGRPFVDPAAPVTEVDVRIPLNLVNRHGLIAGAPGPKTKTLQLIAEQLSAAGCPVFAPDMKGDVADSAPGDASRPSRSATTPPTTGRRRHPRRDRVAHRRGRRPHPRVAHPVRPDASLQGPRPQRDPGVELALVFRFARNGAPPHRPRGPASRARLPRGPGKKDLRVSAGSPRRRSASCSARFTARGRRRGHLLRRAGFDILDLVRTAPDGRGVATVLSLPSVATACSPPSSCGSVRTVRGAARGGRSGEADARFLLRRGAPARRRQQGVLEAVTQTVRLIRRRCRALRHPTSDGHPQ